MADTKTSDESAAATLDGTELIRGVQSAANVKITAAQVVNLAKLQKLSVFAATTSAELASVISNETGSGLLVFATSPTLTTPVLGVAAATSINKVAITAPATSATLTIADGKTLTVSNTLTFTGTDGSSIAFGAGGTVPYTSNNLSVFAATTSAQLAGVISDETGTGLLVFATTPTLTGQPVVQGLTTTSPGWYAQITGDSVPRVRVGVNANDVASIGFGSGAATRDLFLERAGAANLRFGNIDAAAPVAQTLSVQNVITGTSNTAGANFTIAGSQSTGNAAGGSIIFQASPADGSGTSVNALVTYFTIAPATITLSSASLVLSGNISAAAWTTNGLRIKGVAATLTDTTSSGTVAAAYTDVLGGNTIAASSATTFTDYYTAFFVPPTAGSNVTFTRFWALGTSGGLNSTYTSVASQPAALFSGTVFTGGSATTTKPHVLIEPTGTTSTAWSTSGTQFGVNAVSGFGGNLIDLQVAATSQFKVTSTGAGTFGAGITAAGIIVSSSTGFRAPSNGTYTWSSSSSLSAPASGSVQFANNGTTNSFILSSPTATATPTMQQGALDAAAPVAQITRVQSVVAGTSNTAGALWTIDGSVGTGTGAGGDILFQIAPAGTTGTAQNTLVAALRLTSTKSIILGSAAIATNATDGFLYIPTCAGTPTGTPTAATGRVALLYDTTNKQFWIYDGAWLQPKTPAGAALVTWQ